MITRAPRHTSLGDGVDPDVLSVFIPGAAAVHPRSVGVWPGGEIRAGFGGASLRYAPVVTGLVLALGVAVVGVLVLWRRCRASAVTLGAFVGAASASGS